MDYTQLVILFLIAIVANWFSALAGGGAGLIQLPLLIFLGLPFPLALATHKVATVALGLGRRCAICVKNTCSAGCWC